MNATGGAWPIDMWAWVPGSDGGPQLEAQGIEPRVHVSAGMAAGTDMPNGTQPSSIILINVLVGGERAVGGWCMLGP